MSTRILRADPRLAQFSIRYPSIIDPEHPEVVLPEVVLPAGKSYASQWARGITNFVALDDAQQRRLAVDESFQSMMKANGKKGAPYMWRDDLGGVIPDYALPQGSIITKLQQENARLRAELRKNEIPVPAGIPAEPVAVKADEAEPEPLNPNEPIMLEKEPGPGGRTRAKKAKPMTIGGQSSGDILSGLPK